MNKQNEKYKDINNLKNIINNGYENTQEMGIIKDSNKALTIKAKALENLVKDKDKKISRL